MVNKTFWQSFYKVQALKNIIVIICICSTVPVCAQDPVNYRTGAVKSRISIAPAASLYKNHPQHTTATKANAGFCASYKSEILLGRRMSFLAGLDYLSQGLSFRGYYVAPGYTYLFDKTYAYTHEIRVQELHLPIGVKKAFNSEKDNFYTPYYYGGAGFRYILSSYYIITNDSTETVVYDGKGTMDFEYQVFTQLSNGIFKGKGASVTKKLNSFIFGGIGIQRNLRDSGKAVYFDLCYKYGISRLHYSGYNNSNNLNIKDSHLLFNFGLKF